MPVASPELRVFLADDHPVVLAGVKALIGEAEGLRVVGEAHDGRSALSGASDLQPDIVVLDISMPGYNGIKVAELLRGLCPRSKILALTVHEDKGYLLQLLKIGVAGYILKRSASEELVRAVRAVASGGIYIDPAVAPKLLDPGMQKLDAATGEAAELSEREAEVLRLTAVGHSHKAIANDLKVSVKSVETYKARGMSKLGFESRVQLVRYAVSKGWLDA